MSRRCRPQVGTLSAALPRKRRHSDVSNLTYNQEEKWEIKS